MPQHCARSARCTVSTARALALIPLVAGLASVSNPAAAQSLRPHSVRCDTAALIAAIDDANANGGGELSLSRRCVYDFRAPVSGQDATPAITVPLTIKGNGATLLRDPATTSHFRLIDVAVGGTAAVSHLTIRNGDVTGDGGGVLVQKGGTFRGVSITVQGNTASGDGGGIDDRGTLKLTGSLITDNTALLGGGLYIEPGGTADVIRTTVRDNKANSFAGGGVVNDSGAITIARDLIVGNSVATGDGGGLWNDGQMTVNDSEIADNTARDHGAGVTNAQGGKATFNQSTIRNNRAGLQAGGIYNVNADSTVVLNVSRVVKNSSANAPGGVYNGAGSAVVNKRSTIAENTPTNCTGSPSPVPGCTN
ncbi:hypothetical protein ACFXC9_13440 [Streptomyces naganishii]|uniref:hypothetical protein n=1 Tax=Streptomyces naganishii TaxID=285447 RepID=UPI0036931211